MYGITFLTEEGENMRDFVDATKTVPNFNVLKVFSHLNFTFHSIASIDPTSHNHSTDFKPVCVSPTSLAWVSNF